MEKRFSQLHEKICAQKAKVRETISMEEWVGQKIGIASKKCEPTKNAEFNRSKSRCPKLENK